MSQSVVDGSTTDSRPRAKALDLIVAQLPVAGLRLVDVGCGEGVLVRALTRLGARVIGVECGATMLALARGAVPMGDETYCEGVGQALPLADASADGVIFMNSLHHVPESQMLAALAEAARVVVAGGWVVVNEPLPEGRFYALTRQVEDEEAVRAAALRAVRACSQAGLREEAEILYRNPVRMDSYAAFAARMGNIDPQRQALVAAREETLRADFHRLAEPLPEGGFLFDQPARLSLLRKGLIRP